jgi:hypothetical protein
MSDEIIQPGALMRGDEVLPLVRVDEVTTELTLEQRVANIERALRGYIDNPPKLADAERLGNEIAAVNGKAMAALDQVAALSNMLPDRMNLVEQRVGTVERDLFAVAGAKDVVLTVQPHDAAHQVAQVTREFRCPACGTGFSDVVAKAAAVSTQRPCPMCGRSVEVSTVTLFDVPSVAAADTSSSFVPDYTLPKLAT